MKESSARTKITQARTALVLDQPFFGALALRLKIVEDPGCGTAWVDGVSLGYDPAFVDGLTHAQTVALVAHEVMHCACGHPWRRDGRDKDRWNQAADYAINGILRESGFTLPESALMPDGPLVGKNAEWIYDRMPQPSEEDENGGSGGQGAASGPNPQVQTGAGQPGGDESGSGNDPLGEVRDAPNGTDAGEGDWDIAVQQAARAAQARGDLPAGLARFASDQARPRVDWRSALRRLVQQARADYSWRLPNARYVARGLYMPALRNEEMGPIAVAIDTSGSIDEALLAQFAAELQAAVDDASPARVHVLYCDARIHRVDTFERGETVEVNPAGGGGTDFRPVFDWLDTCEETPAALVYLTDLDGRFPSETPEIPTLWATTTDYVAPFGETLRIE
jgi:predicted metal-dependent peptidase